MRVAGDALAIMGTWFKANRFKLNVSKSKFMVFSHPNTNVGHVPTTLTSVCNSCSVFATAEFKPLGVYIDNKLTYKIHIAFVNGKLA